MQVAKWSGTWDLLGCIALSYPDAPTRRQKGQVRDFLYALMDVLPCYLCAASSHIFIRQLPPEPFLNDRAGICVWLYLFKAKVNAKLGKQNCSFSEFIKKYESCRARCTDIGCTESLPCPSDDLIDAWATNALAKYTDIDGIVSTFYRNKRIDMILYTCVLTALLWAILQSWRARSE